jgi:hypothetical protein
VRSDLDKVKYPYLITNTALADIKSSWKIEELARKVIQNAGLPYMTYKKASQIAANCRYAAIPQQQAIHQS